VCDFNQAEHRCALADFSGVNVQLLGIPHQCHARGFAAWVDLQRQRLQVAMPCLDIDQTDDKRHEPMHAGTSTREQKPRTLLCTRHHRHTLSIQYKHAQTISPE
jgi:hypothetical protein